MTNRARMYLRYRDLDIPTSWEEAPPGARASRPQPYSCKQPAIQGHSLEQCTKPALAGFATMAPSPMRARRPRSRGGFLPFTLAPQESVSGCRAAALPCRSCERASCNIGSGTGRFAGNRDVLPISIVGCDLVKMGSSPQKAQKSQNEFPDFESWQSEVDPHGDALAGCRQIARNLCDGFGSQRLSTPIHKYGNVYYAAKSRRARRLRR